MIDFEKKLIKEVVVDASVAIVWKKWTTTEGITSFFAPQADIELVIGGKFELYFMLDNPTGEQGSEDCKILSFLPEMMLSFSWNAPPQFPNSAQTKALVCVGIYRVNKKSNPIKINWTWLATFC
jgi:uncharacterized protein YndB with AHSA1/START domain